MQSVATDSNGIQRAQTRSSSTIGAAVEVIDPSEIFHRAATPGKATLARVRLDGGEISLTFQRRESRTLIVTFHGAIDRSKLRLPQFGGKRLDRYVDSSVLSLADPSLERDRELPAAWYCGHEGFELQQILPDFIQKFSVACEALRVIFIGGSVGGFAALYYAWRHPGSVALVTNSQTNIERYNKMHQRRYREACRPGLLADHSLSEVIVSDLTVAYGERFENTVVYLQNAADDRHVRNHFAPFVAAIALENQSRLLPRLEYWGQGGHSPAPPSVWLAWLNAILASPSESAEDIQATRKEYVPGSDSREAQSALRIRIEDAALADILAHTAREPG